MHEDWTLNTEYICPLELTMMFDDVYRRSYKREHIVIGLRKYVKDTIMNIADFARKEDDSAKRAAVKFQSLLAAWAQSAGRASSMYGESSV